MFVPLVMMNLLIALMGGVYDHQFHLSCILNAFLRWP